jgi:hypothetical protein
MARLFKYKNLDGISAREFFDMAREEGGVVVVTGGGEEVPMMAGDELQNVLEHLTVLTPLENTRALVDALEEADRGESVTLTPEMRARLSTAAAQGDKLLLQRELERLRSLAWSRRFAPPPALGPGHPTSGG